MCMFGGGSPPPSIEPVAPPLPPAPVAVPPPAQLAIVPPLKNEQLRPVNPVVKKRGSSRRGKAMLKVPMNMGSGGGGVNG